jgi:autotransporter-associated beta strand protein
MKKIGLLALLLAAPLATPAQFVIFTDNFTNSTLNQTSAPGGSPFASFTSYDIAATKNATTGPALTNGEFKIRLNTSTSSGLLEAQAVFTKDPITLVNVGDSITLSYTFRMTNALQSTSAYLGQGLYNSGGTVPVPGNLNNSGLGTGNFVTGNAQLWQGIYSRFFNATSGTFFRPPQSNGPATSASQDLLGPGVTGGFTAPGPTTLPGSTATAIALTDGSYYNINMTLYLADTNTDAQTQTLNITNTLSDTSGNVIATYSSSATGDNYMTTFDSLALGRREAPNVLITMVITNLTITANLSSFPGQPFNITGGGIGCPGDSFPVGLNGSITTNDYYVYTNGVWNGVRLSGTGSPLAFPAETVIAVPLTNAIFASNTVTAATGFMLGTAVVAPNAAPAISTQPIPSIVANGSTAEFSVAATGGGLTFQWFKNGTALTDNGHISGSQTATLVLTNVGAGDTASTAQGYYVVLTNGCNVTLASATNSLTIAAPANIIWQGNVSSNWDLFTPNFVNNSTPVAFHNGDNVLLDDTAVAPVLSIADKYITPSSVTNSSGLTYIINGPGVIQGAGALVMNGGGTMSINNSNAFTGGGMVNSGTLIMSNQFALGPSTITLGGGILDMQVSFGSAAGLSNNINVTGPAQLQLEKTGTFGFVLDGALTGDPAGTLTVLENNGGTGTARFRLYSAFTNNAAMVLNSGGTEIEFAPYLDSGNQIYAGIISGGGGHIVPRGAGNAIFTATNTFNDSGTLYSGIKGYSVFMSSGNVGIGADSVSTTPGIIDGSPVGSGWLGINVGAEGGTSTLFAYGGAHTIGNLVGYTSATNTVTLILGGTNNLTFSGEFDLANPDNTQTVGLPTDTTGTNRTLQVTNTAATTFSGFITDNTHPSGIIKTGNGTLYLDGTTNNFTGPTTVSAGVLAGAGTITSPVDVQTNGAIGGGSAAAIGTFTVNSSLTFDSGGISIRVNKALSPAQSNDLVSVTGSITANAGAGTVTVQNIGAGAFNVGDTFKILNKAVTGAGSFNIVGGGMNWNNNLAVDGTITAASVNTGPATNPTNMTFSVSGGNLTITWPTDHLGWYLQENTNGLSSNTWTSVVGSNTGTNSVIPINSNIPKAFFRMSLQP